MSLSLKDAYRSLSGLTLRGLTLPQHSQDQASKSPGKLGVCVHSTAASAGVTGTHILVLLCVPYMRVGAKLYQPETCTINSDREFFQVLRHYYSTWRWWSPWTRLRQVQSLKFVKFEVFQSSLVDIRQSPSTPPTSLIKVEYIYSPTPNATGAAPDADADTLPPIGPNLLTHLFEYPDHAEVLTILCKRVPKKLRSCLEACRQQGSSVGWGIQIEEGLNWFSLFLFGLLGFVLCLLIAVAWTIVKGDVQGGFSIASFMLSFMVFCGGLVYSEKI